MNVTQKGPVLVCEGGLSLVCYPTYSNISLTGTITGRAILGLYYSVWMGMTRGGSCKRGSPGGSGPPPPFEGTPNFIKRGETSHTCAGVQCALVVNSYPPQKKNKKKKTQKKNTHTLFPKSCICPWGPMLRFESIFSLKIGNGAVHSLCMHFYMHHHKFLDLPLTLYRHSHEDLLPRTSFSKQILFHSPPTSPTESNTTWQ